MQDDFYAKVPPVRAFADLLDGAAYRPVPGDWFVGVSDIVSSTALITAGRYKTVNMVGAAVIAAVTNALEGAEFPFVFGGDGASFAVPPAQADRARQALAQVVRWAKDSFDIELRAALLPMHLIEAAGRQVQVARFQVSEGADYAMFQGGGLSWAEAQIKAGQHLLDPAPSKALPDLSGLSCRWSHMPARNGRILSLLVVPQPTAPASAVAGVFDQVVQLAQGLAGGGHPVPPAGPGAGWPPKGAWLEAHARRREGALAVVWLKALFESFVAWLLIRTGWTLAGFDARRYARVVGQNADFRKLDDGLKMTLDCDAATEAQILACLETAEKTGLVRFGHTTQDEAMMTCIVPSILTDNHLHFIDGASGGYALAATRLKAGSG